VPEPPPAANVLVYAEPTSPPGSDGVLTVSVGPMTIDRLADRAVSLLVSVTLKRRPFVVPAVVGVPEMTPEEVLSVSPPGRVPELSAHVE
jgi:hypothetical protein